jgi:hypothetical protein
MLAICKLRFNRGRKMANEKHTDAADEIADNRLWSGELGRGELGRGEFWSWPILVLANFSLGQF